MTTFGTTAVRFSSGDGECVGDLLVPDGTPGPGPVVVMAHGIGAERRFGLSQFAERFTSRGLAALVFDYRNFGDSPGEPRALVSPRRHREDYRAALAFARGHPALDGGRMALWGTSFSGGHVLVVAGEGPPGVRAVVSQIPFVSGISSTLAYPLRYHVPAILLDAADRTAALVGLDPITVPVVRERGLALLASPDAHDGYMAMVPEGADWPGRVPARVFLSVLAYHPIRHARRIRVPTLILAAARDAICPVGPVRKVARRIPDARLEEFPIGHFDPYAGEWFERFVTLEADFLEELLEP